MPTARKIRLLSNSRVKTARRCGRLHQFKYELGYETTATQEALVFGDIAHQALEQWWEAWLEGRGQGSEAARVREALAPVDDAVVSGRIDSFTGARLHAILEAYDNQWSPEMFAGDWEILGIENEFVTPLIDGDGQRIPGWVLGGKMDVIARHLPTGRVLIIEHKTSGEDVARGSAYWKRLRLEGQPTTYLEAARQLGHEAQAVVYDVLRKPDQRPYRATPEAERRYTKGKAPHLYKHQHEADETVGEYLGRCRTAIAEKPEAFLLREEVVRLEREMDEHRRDVADAALTIDRWRERGHSPKSPDHCVQFGRECSFMPVCLGQASLSNERLYRQRKTVHPELSYPERPEGAELITA